MAHDLNRSLALLERFPGSLEALLIGLPEEWTSKNEGGQTWSVREVVGHLAYVEANDWMSRLRTILEAGEAEPFRPLDREGFRNRGEDVGVSEFLAEFRLLRAGNVEALRALQLDDADWARTGRHPAFGVVTLSQLLSAWVVHDLTHLHQISRVLAYPYGDAVGPWREYLGVLRCLDSVRE